MTSFLDQFRRDVSREDAGIAMAAAHRQLKTGKPIPVEHLKVLLALAVEQHAPKREEAQRGAER